MNSQSTLQLLLDVESQLESLEQPILGFDNLDDEDEEALRRVKNIHKTLESMYKHVHKIVKPEGSSSIYAHIVHFFRRSHCPPEIQPDGTPDEGAYISRNPQ
jgi:hypothetical protein